MLCLCPEHASSEQIGVFDLYMLNKQIFLTLDGHDNVNMTSF
jgi:hypothetical protein